jgi:hypothetical protein
MSLPDGTYKTRPKWGNINVVREVVILNTLVVLDKFKFTQDDFFRVNILIEVSILTGE